MFWTTDAAAREPIAREDVLRAAMRAFRQVALDTARDPVREACTLAEFAEIVAVPGLDLLVKRTRQ